MKQIILIRHVQVAENSKARRTSALDPSISALGRKQALAVKKFLKKYDYEVIFTSLYKRAIETAELLNVEKAPMFRTSAFNDYYIRPDGQDVETASMGLARSMMKIYSMFDTYSSILIVGHDNMNKTILRAFLNIEFEKASNYFKQYGETHVIRRDWKAGDKTWQIIDSFIPER